MRPDPATAPIFVIGTGRSGTTLLRQMLCAHPRIHLTHEASFYLWELQTSEPLRDYLKRYLDGLSFRWLCADPGPMLESLRADSPHHAFYTNLMRTMAARHGKVRFGDKTPGHSGKLHRIFEDYPDARVVRIVRSPVAVVRSLNRMPWFPRSLISGAVLVGQEERQCAPYSDRIHQVSLEALVADPEPVLRGILEFVGEEWDDAVLDHTNHGPKPTDLPPMPWFQRATTQARAGAPQAAEVPDPVATRLVELLTRKARHAHGYDALTVAREPSWFALAWRYLWDLTLFATGSWAFFRCLAAVAAEGGTDDPVMHRRFAAINPPAWERYPGFSMPSPPPLPEGWAENLPPG